MGELSIWSGELSVWSDELSVWNCELSVWSGELSVCSLLIHFLTKTTKISIQQIKLTIHLTLKKNQQFLHLSSK